MGEESLLRKKRLEKNLTLDDVEKILKIRKRHLQALEEGNYTDTPGITYAIGYLRAYGTLLELTDEERKEIVDEINSVFMNKKKNQTIPEKEIIPLDEGEEQKKEGQKERKPSSVNFKKMGILTSVVIIIGVLGFFGFKLLTQSEEFSFSKTGVYTPYVKVTVKAGMTPINNKNVTHPTPQPTGVLTPSITQTPSTTPTPLPKVMAKYNVKIVSKGNGWIKVFTKNNTLFEGMMEKGKEFIFKSSDPITVIVESNKLFDVYEGNTKIELPKGEFVKYSVKALKENG